MVLTLIACGGSNPPPASDTPIATPPQNNTPSPTPDISGSNGNGGSTNNGNSGDNGNGGGTDNGNGDDPAPIIPDNGTPPNVSAPLENHAGDKGYFYVTTDDYIVWEVRERDTDNYMTYRMYVFDEDGKVIHRNQKHVFLNETDAKTFAEGGFGVIQIDNVVYRDGGLMMPEWRGGQTKEIQLDIIPQETDNYYISKP